MSTPNGETSTNTTEQSDSVQGQEPEQQELSGSAESTDTPVINSTSQETPSEPSKAPWADYLEKFPQSLHPVAEEVFKEWDGNVTKRFQDLHSTYKPYESLVNDYEPDALMEAVQLAQALERDPQAFAQALANAYGFAESEQGAENQQQEPQAQNVVDEPEFDLSDPFQARLAQQEELLRTLAEKIIGDEQAKTQAAEAAEQDKWLNDTMTSLKTNHGEFDESFVLREIAAGVDPEQAVKNFQGLVSTWASKQNAPAANAPQVMRAGGGLPSNAVNPATLDSRATKDLVAEMLRNSQGG